MVVSAAVQEDVDVVGISILSGAHLTLLGKLKQQMDAEGLTDVPIVAGGVIPDQDIPELKALGVAAVFTPGTPLDTIASYIKDAVPA